MKRTVRFVFATKHKICVSPNFYLHSLLVILNHRKKMKVEQSRMIPRKHTENRELLTEALRDSDFSGSLGVARSVLSTHVTLVAISLWHWLF